MDNTNKTFVQIDSIKPDPNQPRKVFVKEHIEGLSKSLSIEGMINPIEIDNAMKIITGECRWRAAKALGWEEVPVVINNSNYSSYERLRHQMAENIHQSGSTYDAMMNPVDTARGYARMYELKYNVKYSPGEYLGGKGIGGEGAGEKGPSELIAEEIGISKTTVWEHLKILEEPEAVQKAIQEGTPRTYFREIMRAPDEIRDQMRGKIISGDYKSRNEITQDVELLKKIPDLAKLEIERTKTQESVVTNKILNTVAKLALAMEKLPFEKVDIREQGIVEKQLNWLILEIQGYLMVRGEEV